MFESNLELLQWLAILAVSFSILAISYSIYAIRSELPGEDRTYKDPLPRLIRMVWPLVRVFAHNFGERLPADFLEKYQKLLRKSGLDYLFSPSELFGLQIVSALITLGMSDFILSSLDLRDFLLESIGAGLGFAMPLSSITSKRKKRELQLTRELPVYLDFLTMAVQAGMNMSGAIAQAVSKGPEGALRYEFQKVQRDMKAGMSRSNALREMADRLEIRDITGFVTAVVQAEKTGASVGISLKAQADQRRSERFQRAEKAAMEAPVKLIFPLVAFIFPLTFVFIAFPIVMKFMYEI
ncbi:MAG: type II secretion system F family protein [Gammaproteobacteria bacterium]|nr:type II secretion system F family protein [Gammaproteobacteria bacterium]